MKRKSKEKKSKKKSNQTLLLTKIKITHICSTFHCYIINSLDTWFFFSFPFYYLWKCEAER